MKTAALLTTLTLTAGLGHAADPVVSNVFFHQRTDGSGLIDVNYRLADADGDSCCISMRVSKDGGLSWEVPCPSVAGDVGPGITPDTAPGAGHEIVWNAAADLPGLEQADVRVRVIASDLGIDHAAHSPHNYAALHYGEQDWTDEAMIERVSRADLLVLTAADLWDGGANEALHVVDRIKSYNPDCKVIGYVSAKTVRLAWENKPPGSSGRELWDSLRPYWCWTTEGDTLADWYDVVVVNLLDPDCRDAIVSNIEQHQQSSPNHLDGVFWDYFNTSIWVPDFLSVEGDPDLDGDGVAMQSDPDEIAAYKQACEDMVTDLRSRLGDGFVQIFNGQRAYTDSVFASLADGINYELFPTLTFPPPDKLHFAIDPTEPISLWNARRWVRTTAGGPYILIENIYRYRFYDESGAAVALHPGNLFRAISLLIDGCWPVWDDIDGHEFSWPEVPVSLGAPLGPPTIASPEFTRRFEHGDVRLELKDNLWPNAFRYTIRIGDHVVEELDVPHHIP